MARQGQAKQGAEGVHCGCAGHAAQEDEEVKFGSCFAGIGGFDLGLEAAGFQPAWQVELSEYCRGVLARHWPDVARYDDVRAVPQFALESVDLICGGFPCQDVSVAGKQEGLEGERSRLWYDMYKIIARIRPRWLVVENSPALRTRGADTVLGGLEEVGYSCWPLVVGAYAVGAPHKRERVWIVGYAGQQRRPAAQVREVRAGRGAAKRASDLADAGFTGCEGSGQQRVRDPIGEAQRDHAHGCDDALEYTKGPGLERPGKRLLRRWPVGPVEPQQWWEPPRTVERKVGSRADGLSGRMAERRRKREIEALGAAVVPQVAEAIGRAIQTVEAMEQATSQGLIKDIGELFA